MNLVALLEQNSLIRKSYLAVCYAKLVLFSVTCDQLFKTWLKSSTDESAIKLTAQHQEAFQATTATTFTVRVDFM